MLVNVAIAGVARQEIPEIAGDDAPARFCAHIPPAEKPAQLFNFAGTLALYRTAGALPPHDDTQLPAPAPAETLAYCNSAAMRLLQLAIADTHLLPILPEWIALAQARRLLIPPAILPGVLTAGMKSSELRQLLLPIIGERGLWLAKCNPDWHAYLRVSTAVEMHEVWETGTRAERAQALHALRTLDPAGARILLEATWSTEPLDTLTALLPALEVGLCSDDAPFLESLLDDKRKTIRRPAAELLARLPGSVYQQRMIERVASMITITPAQAASVFPPRVGRRMSIEVTLPETFDARWTRDAIEETPPQGSGRKSWWLQQIIAATPLRYWEEAGQCTAREHVAAVHTHEQKLPLFRGWLLAAQRQRNVDWIGALLEHAEIDDTRPAYAELFKPLTPVEREQVLLSLFSANSQSARAVVSECLSLCTHPWSEALSRQAGALTFDARHPYQLETLAYHIHPRYIATCRAKSRELEQSTTLASFTERVQAVLQYREDVNHAFEVSE